MLNIYELLNASIILDYFFKLFCFFHSLNFENTLSPFFVFQFTSLHVKSCKKQCSKIPLRFPFAAPISMV